MQRLAGKAILILEDEPLIALMIEDELATAGAIVRTASTCAVAIQILKTARFHAAALDVHIGDEDCSEVAEELRRSGTPFIVTTGDAYATDFGAGRRLLKPYSEEQLIQALLGVLTP